MNSELQILNFEWGLGWGEKILLRAGKQAGQPALLEFILTSAGPFIVSDFQWIKLRKRVKDCFTRVHDSWSKAGVSIASEWMTSWYWQNQQLVYLDRWEREGLINECEVFKVNKMIPTLFSYQAEDGNPGEGSELAVLIEANMTDYLMRQSDGTIVEGSQKRKDIERIRSFTYLEGKWVVSDIDEGSNSLAYVEMMKSVPAIEEVFQPEKSMP